VSQPHLPLAQPRLAAVLQGIYLIWRWWDRPGIRRGLAALLHAEELGGPPGPFALHAAIAACHARAASPGDTDWLRIAVLYDALSTLTPSPLIELNRAVALGRAYGPAAGLALADTLAADPALHDCHLVPSLRGDLLARLGRAGEARTEYERAAALTGDGRERAVLLARAQACPAGGPTRADEGRSSGISLMCHLLGIMGVWSLDQPGNGRRRMRIQSSLSTTIAPAARSSATGWRLAWMMADWSAARRPASRRISRTDGLLAPDRARRAPKSVSAEMSTRVPDRA